MTLEIFTSTLLEPLRHGFFTRKGGASSGVFSGLNCGLGSSDQVDVVQMNRAMVADAMGVAPERLTGVHQIHSDTVVEKSGENSAERPKADAMVTAEPGVALGVLAADCAPVLFADPEAGVIGAAHAGWRGALDGVLGQTLSAMRRLGAENICAVIGPCISQRSYEVGPEFFDRFREEDAEFTRYFAPAEGEKFLFDLPGFCLSRLRDDGAEAEWLGHCTYLDPSRFYSFRRTTHNGEADYGRLISSIVL